MPPGARQELRSSPGAPKRAHSTRTETRAVGCGRLLQGPTKRAEGRHVPHMSPFTVELILTAVHCLLIGRPRAPSSPTAREMPRGVAVASIARLPSSTDDPRASGSTADRHVVPAVVTPSLRGAAARRITRVLTFWACDMHGPEQHTQEQSSMVVSKKALRASSAGSDSSRPRARRAVPLLLCRESCRCAN